MIRYADIDRAALKVKIARDDIAAYLRGDWDGNQEGWMAVERILTEALDILGENMDNDATL